MGQSQNSNSPGSGGIQRGRGDAELSLGDPSTPFDAESFEAKRLTPAEYADLDRSALVGVGATAPSASGVSGEATGDAGAATSVGASTWKRRLEPRHRRAVSAFFGGDAVTAPPVQSQGGSGDK